MADKQGRGRKLPTWYLDAVNMASEVFAANPDKTDMRRPAIKGDIGGGGRGVQSQRRGTAWEGHTRPLHAPPSSSWTTAPPEIDNGT